MRMICIFIHGLLIWLAAVFPALVSADDSFSKEVSSPYPPPLIESTRFSGEILFCGIKIPHEDPGIRQRLEKEVLLALWNRPQVILWLKRAAHLFPHIEPILESENLPLDLKYVPVVESALRPHASSAKGAVGYWQFLQDTGRRYGLRIDDGIDERRHLFYSTHAACRYIRKLYTRFDSYLLALSAFNMGEFGLNAEIEAQQTRDFFSLYLPLETQRYPFKIIAAKLIIENPKKYGFHLEPEDLYPPLAFSKVELKVKRKVPLVLISMAAGISFKTLKEYNPHIRGYSADPGVLEILLPDGKAKGLNKRFAVLEKDWKKNNPTRVHVVKPGDSLTAIAEKYDMALISLLRLNNFSYKRVIHPGDRVLVR